MKTKKIKWNVSVRPAVPEFGWGDQKASSEEMLISDQQLKIEFSSHSFFYKIESLISFPLSSAITFLFRAVCFSSPHDADIGENRPCDQLKECLCVRQGAGTTVYASPHSVSLSFTFLKLFLHR